MSDMDVEEQLVHSGSCQDNQNLQRLGAHPADGTLQPPISTRSPDPPLQAGSAKSVHARIKDCFPT